MAAAEGTPLRIIPAVELNTDAPRGEVHVLGYFVEYGPGPFQERLRTLRSARFDRGRRIVEKVNALGLALSWSRVQEFAGDGAIGRPHVARALIEAGHADSVQEAFDRYIGSGRPAYVERVPFGPEDAIREILGAGGVPVLAHPVLNASAMAGEEPALTTLLAALAPRLDDLQIAGLRGLETYYPGYDQALISALEQIAADRSLLRTGGSDYHGGDRIKADLGAVPIPADVATTVVAALRALAR